MTLALLALEHRAFGDAAFGYRLVSWVLHLGCSLGVLRLALLLGLDDGAALVAASWFAIHPLHVEVVTGIVGQGELLQTAFTLAAVLAFSRRGVRSSLSWPVFAVAALLAKEDAIVAPLLAAATAAWVRARRGSDAARSPGAALMMVPLIVP